MTFGLTKFIIATFVWMTLSSMCLSAFGVLNRTGCIIALLVGVVVFLCFRLKRFGSGTNAMRSFVGMRWQRFRIRLSFHHPRRVLPCLFLLGALLSLAGGLLFAPSNYDFLSYRIPRVLNWLAEGGWHWIETSNQRLNYSGTGQEAFLTFLVASTGSDRLAFLPNLLVFLALPGLVFHLFVQLGIRPRVAWFWMWIFPFSYCFLMQAGSAGNDLLGAFFFLAACALGLRARAHGSASDACWALLAAAIMTAVKISNLPLLLPIAWLLWPSASLLLRSAKMTTCTLVIGTLVSALPILVANHLNAGHWSGSPDNSMRLTSPLHGIAGNVLLLVADWMQTPVQPFAGTINAKATEQLSGPIGEWLRSGFPRFGFRLGELPMEEGGGLGMGIVVLLVLCMAFARPQIIRHHSTRFFAGFTICMLIVFMVYLTKLGSEYAARLLAPYYIGLLPILLVGVPSTATRRPIFSYAAILVALLTLAALIITPARPLLPARSLANLASTGRSQNKAMQRVLLVYETYQDRPFLFTEILNTRAESNDTILLVSNGNEIEGTAWKPYGTRKVITVKSFDALPKVPGLILLREDVFNELPPEDYILIDRRELKSKASVGAEKWVLVRKK